MYDQDGNTITDMTDDIIHIQFTINKKSKQEILYKSLIDYNKQSYLILGHIFDIMNNIYSYFLKNLNTNAWYIMPSVKGIGFTNFSSRPIKTQPAWINWLPIMEIKPIRIKMGNDQRKKKLK